LPEKTAMSGRSESAERRKQRLAKALKANLAKRKAQAKERTAPSPSPDPSPGKAQN
jgi:hypothetical protein